MAPELPLKTPFALVAEMAGLMLKMFSRMGVPAQVGF